MRYGFFEPAYEPLHIIIDRYYRGIVIDPKFRMTVATASRGSHVHHVNFLPFRIAMKLLLALDLKISDPIPAESSHQVQG